MAEGKIALVTGAGSGIGRATALLLQKKGYSVVLTGRRLEALEETAGMAASDGGKMLPISVDIADPDSVAAAFKQTRDEFGRLDLLFNNAGTSAPGVPMEELTPKQWQDVVNVNVNGTFYCAQEAIKIMKAQDPKGGRIINNGSISAHAPRPFSVAYTATKHAITGMTKTISLDGRKDDIACGQIDIGNALTERTVRMTKGVPQADGSTKIEPVMTADQVAGAVLYMDSLPLETNVQFMTIMATKMPFIGRG
jgi:NADP-dependent 3-hydroxy acid dehydrogenase YdfG